MDGFGGGDSNIGKWDNVSVGYTPQTSNPRLPGGYYASIGAGANIYKTIPASSKVILGTGYNHGLSSTAGSILFYGDGGVTHHITVQHNNSSGVIQILRGGTLVASGTTVIPNYTWFYLEMSVTISDTVGEVHVRLNGSPTDEVSFIGDTKNGGTATTIDRVRFSSGWAGGLGSAHLADLYILDGTGTTNNNFLGDVAVRTLSPAGNGNSSQLVGSDGNSVDNYLLVDEHPYSGTDYAGSATVGQKDTYAMSDLPVGVSSVYAVQIAGTMAKSDASLAQARYVLRSGATDYGGTTRALSTSYIGYYELYTTNPATGLAWTPTQVNAIEAGMEVM